MYAPFVIAGNDLRRRVRDRSAITITLIAPVAIAALMSIAFSGAETFHYKLGLVDADHGPIARGLVAALEQPGLRKVVTLVPLSNRSQAAAEVNSKAVGAALVVPAGFSQAVTSAGGAHLDALTSVNNTLAGNITEAIASSFVAQVNADRLSVSTAMAAGAPPGSAAQLAAKASNLRLPISLVQRSLGAHPITMMSYYGPAMAIFFLLFTVSFVSRSFFTDRDGGMIERMRAAPLRSGEILFGKALSTFAFGLTSLAVIWAVTSIAFGADWGSPLAASIVCLVTVGSVVCLTALVIVIARTQRQSEGISAAVVFILALIGGNFVFISAAPPLMRRLALFTPNGWAMRGLTDLSTTGGGIGTVAGPVLAILAFDLVAGGVATVLARKALVR